MVERDALLLLRFLLSLKRHDGRKRAGDSRVVQCTYTWMCSTRKGTKRVRDRKGRRRQRGQEKGAERSGEAAWEREGQVSPLLRDLSRLGHSDGRKQPFLCKLLFGLRRRCFSLSLEKGQECFQSDHVYKCA